MCEYACPVGLKTLALSFATTPLGAATVYGCHERWHFTNNCMPVRLGMGGVGPGAGFDLYISSPARWCLGFVYNSPRAL